jgi:hypothetical protein
MTIDDDVGIWVSLEKLFRPGPPELMPVAHVEANAFERMFE